MLTHRLEFIGFPEGYSIPTVVYYQHPVIHSTLVAPSLAPD